MASESGRAEFVALCTPGISGDYKNLLKRKFKQSALNQILSNSWFRPSRRLMSKEILQKDWCFTSKDFRKLLDEFDVVQSFSGRGCPYDNAVAESFFKYLKKEEIYRKIYSDFSDLQSSLVEYLEGFYNPKRPHSSNDFLSPDDFESAYFLHIY